MRHAQNAMAHYAACARGIAGEGTATSFTAKYAKSAKYDERRDLADGTATESPPRTVVGLPPLAFSAVDAVRRGRQADEELP